MQLPHYSLITFCTSAEIASSRTLVLCTSLSLQPDLQRTCPSVGSPNVQVKDVRGGQDEKGESEQLREGPRQEDERYQVEGE